MDWPVQTPKPEPTTEPAPPPLPPAQEGSPGKQADGTALPREEPQEGLERESE